MAGRPKYYTDEELIDRATKVFWKKGYSAASAKDLLKGMDIGQGSFYRSFPGGKRELYQKSMIRFLETSQRGFHKGLDNCENPLQYVKDFFNTIPIRTNDEISNGCYLGNSIVELSNLDEDSLQIAKNLLKKLKDGFEKALTMAKNQDKLSAGPSPKILALFLINLWNGINITQRMQFSQDELKQVLEFNLNILN